MFRHLTKQQQYKMSRNTLISNPFSRDQRTSFWMRINAALESYFRKENVPTDREIDFLAESLKLERKVVNLWFSNRRQKEKRKIWSGVVGIRFAEMLVTQSKKKAGGRSQNGMDLFSFPLHFTGHASHFKRFGFGKPNPEMLTRTAIFMATENGLVHQKFINQIINYIVDVQENDKFRFQLVDEDGDGHSNCISIYDIHHTEGFRIPFSLTIVVTPYSGDSEDSDQLFRDRKAAEMFLEFIEAKDGIKELDMICNVTVETGGRKQQFLSIFGKDVEKNINNWKLSVDFLSDNGPWQAVVHHFFTVLATMKTAPLLLTKMVLHERKKMEEVVDRLQPLVAAGSSKMEEMNKAKLTIAYCDYQLKTIEQEMYLNYTSSTASASCTCPELHCRMGPVDNHSVINFSGGGEMCIEQDPSSNPWCNNPNYGDPQSYYFDEAKWNDMKSKGQQLVKILQKDLLKNGNAIRHHLNYIWRCIHRFNKFALHGNSFSNKKVFDLLLEAGQHLKELNF